MTTKLPKAYLEKMQNLLKEDYNDYLQSFQENRYYGLRVNTHKISVEDFLKISPFSLKPIPWTTNGFYYTEDQKPAKHPYYYAGLYYLQEPSAMFPAQVLEIEENDLVLDTCAAPGGKSTELAAKLKGTGLLLSNDISTSRCKPLIKNLELIGITNAWVCSEDLIQLSKYFKNTFDKILVDAPCSGEGMFRKDPSLINSWIEKNDNYYPTIQKEILSSAIAMLKEGGKLVYSTCTFSIKENEEVIQSILNTYTDIELIPIKQIDGFTRGINMEECVRLYPHKIQGEGHFVCLMRKKGNLLQTKPTIKKSCKLPQNVQDFLNLCTFDFDAGSFEIKNDKVLWNQREFKEQKKWRLLRSGLLVGEILKNHFEPSQALAMALKEDQFKNTINFSSHDGRIIKYLKGETIEVKDIDTITKGWILICVDHYPCGFGKIDKGIIKNKYAKGWRYL